MKILPFKPLKKLDVLFEKKLHLKVICNVMM